jgi:hypothetical protein
MKSLSILCLAIVFCFGAVNAQENYIEYGEQVTVEFTEASSERVFKFEGEAEDIIVIEMYPAESPEDLDTPVLVLRNASNNILVSSEDLLSFGRGSIAWRLHADGTYTLEATLREVSESNGIGEFVMDIIDVPTLQVATEVRGSVNRAEHSDYYVIYNEGRTLNLTYTKESGTFSPDVSLSRLGQNGGLRNVIELSGEELLQVQVNVPTNQSFYIVKVGSILNSPFSLEGTADYLLELAVAE